MSINFKLLLLFIFLSFSVFGEDMKVLFKKGDVHKISLNSEKVNLKVGDFLVEEDILITGEKSFVVLTIKGHSTHKIEENSEITIASLPYYFEDSKVLDQGANLLLKAGTIFSDVIKSNGKKSLSIKSNNTVMGVRGTKLLVSRDKETENVWLLVKKGEVEIHNELSGDKDILIKEQGIVVENDREFTAIKRYSVVDDLSWDMTPKGGLNSFSVKREFAQREFSKKKSKWIRNEVIYKEKQKRWESEQREYIQRTKKLKPVKRKLRRKKMIKASVKKNPQDLARGIRRKNKIRKNDFLELQQRRRIERKLDNNDLLRNRNRNRPRPVAPSIPQTIPPNSSKD